MEITTLWRSFSFNSVSFIRRSLLYAHLCGIRSLEFTNVPFWFVSDRKIKQSLLFDPETKLPATYFLAIFLCDQNALVE